MRTHTYTVVGCWPFPLDMLRHDQSGAATPEDQAVIDRLSGEHAPDKDAFQKVSITLVGPNKPNTARWESFTWAIPADREWTSFKQWKTEDRRLAELRNSARAKLTFEEFSALTAGNER